MNRFCLVLVASSLLAGVPVRGQTMSEMSGIHAHIRLDSFQVQVAKPVWATFVIENSSNDAVTLVVPGTEPEIPLPEVGLPLSHIFSGGSSSGVTVTTASGRRWDKPSGYHLPKRAPIVMIAAHSMVGHKIDLREYFPALRAAGRYQIGWHCYGGAIRSHQVTVTIAPRQDVEITTDDGTMRVQLFFEDAPRNVANFLELIKDGFYDGKTFHRLETGYLLQGGCPRGDGSGIRPDGKRVPAEFNGRINQKGTLAMALLEGDPASASCQFFISNTRMRELDGTHTVFGRLVGEDSFATLDNLMATPVDDRGQPLRTLRIRRMRLIDAPSDAFENLP